MQVGVVESGCDCEFNPNLNRVAADSATASNVIDLQWQETESGNVEHFVVEQDRSEAIFKEPDVSQSLTAPQTDNLPAVNKSLASTYSREPSFIYDTTVEAFGNRGAKSLDDLDMIIDTGLDEEEDDEDAEDTDKSESAGISVIGKLVLSVDDGGASSPKGIDRRETEEGTGFHDGGSLRKQTPTRVSVADISCTAEEQQHIGSVDIPIQWHSSSAGRHHHHRGGGGGGTSSVEEKEEKKISSTPEAEAYFYRREQSFIKKLGQGELGQLAVVVPEGLDQRPEDNNDDNLLFSATACTDHELCVKPVLTGPEVEIEITHTDDLTDKVSGLLVKPVAKPATGLLSSYESIYDRLLFEEEEEGVQPPAGENTEAAAVVRRHIPTTAASLVLGDHFVGAQRQLPDWAGSSFEELFERSAGDLADSILAAATLAVAAEPFERWSAPPGVLEPPMLEAGEFCVRFDPVQERIEGHWQELEILMMEEDQKGECESRGSDL